MLNPGCRLVVVRAAEVSRKWFSSSAVRPGAKAIRFLKSQRRRQKNEARQATLRNSLDVVDPVLGRPETPFLTRILAELKEPNVLAAGYEMEQVEKLIAGIEATKNELKTMSNFNEQLLLDDVEEGTTDARRECVLRILSMRNANNAASMKLALKFARQEFQRFPGDTGSSEVQAACMTVKIQNIAKHIKEHHKDYANTRVLRILVQQRQSILRYLKRDNPERYYWTLQKLGLDDNAVTKEFNMDRRYMQDYKFFGDKILVKDSKKIANEKRKESRKQKRAST